MDGWYLKTPVIDFQFWNTKFREADQALQNRLFALFSALRCPNLRICCSDDICNRQVLGDMQDIMSPSILSSKALEWNTLEVLDNLKSVAYTAMEEDALCFARGLLCLIREDLKSSLAYLRHVTGDWAQIRSLLHVETPISLGWIGLSLRDWDQVVELANRIVIKLEEIDTNTLASMGGMSTYEEYFLVLAAIHERRDISAIGTAMGSRR